MAMVHPLPLSPMSFILMLKAGNQWFGVGWEQLLCIGGNIYHLAQPPYIQRVSQYWLIPSCSAQGHIISYDEALSTWSYPPQLAGGLVISWADCMPLFFTCLQRFKDAAQKLQTVLSLQVTIGNHYSVTKPCLHSVPHLLALVFIEPCLH